MSAEFDPAGPAEPGEGEGVMANFRASGGGVTAKFGRQETVIMRDLVSQVAELVALPESGTADRGDDLAAMVGMSENTELPDDPILARLLPDGYRDDPEASGEFRRFTESGLREAKAAAAHTVLGTLPSGGGRVRLSTDEAEQWLRAMNDVRLALGVNLGVTEDYDELSERIPADDPRSGQVAVYHWLTYLQESLVVALSEDRLRSRGC